MRGLAALIAAMTLTGTAFAQTVGWRGNFTGRFPEATPPVTWSRTPRLPLDDLRFRAARPKTETPGDAAPFDAEHVIRDWLVLGGLLIDDPEKDLDRELVDGEAALQPDEGDVVGESRWQRLTLPSNRDKVGANAAILTMHFVHPEFAFGKGDVEAFYAHAYVHAARAGPLMCVVDHVHGLKVWVNGEVVYREPTSRLGVGHPNVFHYSCSVESGRKAILPASPRFRFELRPGWNRLLFKVTRSAKQREGFFNARFVPVGPYVETNIRWHTRLPNVAAVPCAGTANSNPVVVGDRVFVTCEPDWLVCLDKHTGRVLWKRTHSYYDCLTDAEKRANPVFAEKVDPILTKLHAAEDDAEVFALRRTISDELAAVDKDRFALNLAGHFLGHFPHCGWATHTPVSDGGHVWVAFNHYVQACYDLDGNRRWINRLDAITKNATDPAEKREGPYRYPTSPALVSGRFIVVVGHTLVGLDAATGAEVWRDPETYSLNALGTARLGGADVVITHTGDVNRALDGKKLWVKPNKHGGFTSGGSCAVTLAGDTVCLPWWGIQRMFFLDFSKATADAFEPVTHVLDGIIEKGDEASVGASPLYHDGLLYCVNTVGRLFVIDVVERRVVYRQQLPVDVLRHYNAIGLAASPALGGKLIYISDNQGTTVVLQPGREYRQVAVNRIATRIDRRCPWSMQEATYAAPVFDGDRIYIRGEQHLYCIGTK